MFKIANFTKIWNNLVVFMSQEYRKFCCLNLVRFNFTLKFYLAGDLRDFRNPNQAPPEKVSVCMPEY